VGTKGSWSRVKDFDSFGNNWDRAFKKKSQRRKHGKRRILQVPAVSKFLSLPEVQQKNKIHGENWKVYEV
jgi:hypothetical protein